ncbi:hypothetical protein JHU04_003592 [Brenneria sp. 4F2]|nr:hypothetical protein [Brenneria bubanii]
MLCLIHAIDKQGQEELRRSLLSEQISYVNSAGSIKIILAGPLLNQNEGDVAGSLLIVDAKNRNEVDNFINETPFFKSGIWEKIMVNKFTPTNKNII